MESKSEVAYTNALTPIRNWGVPMPKAVVDFEAAQRNVVKRLWPNAILKCCIFHFKMVRMNL